MWRFTLYTVLKLGFKPIIPVLASVFFLSIPEGWFGPVGAVGFAFIKGISISLPIVFLTFFLGRMSLFWWVTRNHDSVSNREVILYFPVGRPEAELRDYLDYCSKTLLELRGFFGFPLKRNLKVYFFSDQKDLGLIFQRNTAHAIALVGADAFILKPTSKKEFDRSTIRHETAHLLAWYLCRFTFPFTHEGLAVLIENELDVTKPDRAARYRMSKEPALHLEWLLEERNFFGVESFFSYMIAASFSGFLIQRFGWQSYWRFFRNARKRNFRTLVKDHFNMDFSDLENAWMMGLFRMKK